MLETVETIGPFPTYIDALEHANEIGLETYWIREATPTDEQTGYEQLAHDPDRADNRDIARRRQPSWADEN